MSKLTTAFLFVSVIIGCAKPDEESGSVNHKVYYDYYSAGIGPGGVFQNFESKRVCYDIEKNQVVWEKTNDHIMPAEYAYRYSDIEYSKYFIKGDYLIKIFPAKDDPGDPTYYANGVFFEKINKYTGELVLSKKIIGSTEFDGGIRYIISNVITEGDNIIFGCNNGSIYSYDINGNNTWKKANLPIIDSDLGNGKASLFQDEGKIYFFSVNPSMGRNELYCLSTQTGETVWHAAGSSYNSIKGVSFDKKNIYIITSCSVYFQDKLTGQAINTAPYYNNCASFFGKSIGSIDGVTSIIFSNRNEIGIIHVPIPDPMPRVSFSDNPFNQNYFLENGLIYGGGSGVGGPYQNRFTFACYNYNLGTFNWKVNCPLPAAVANAGPAIVFNYKELNDEIFILANFHIENGNAIFNEVNPYAPTNNNNLYYSFIHPGVIILDKNSGAIKKQISKMPAGPNGAFCYNFCVE